MDHTLPEQQVSGPAKQGRATLVLKYRYSSRNQKGTTRSAELLPITTEKKPCVYYWYCFSPCAMAFQFLDTHTF